MWAGVVPRSSPSHPCPGSYVPHYQAPRCSPRSLPRLWPPRPIPSSRAGPSSARRAAAYEARDWTAYLAHATRAQALRPEHGGVTLALASARALSRRHRGRVCRAERLRRPRVRGRHRCGQRLRRRAGQPRLPALAARLARNAEPIAEARPLSPSRNGDSWPRGSRTTRRPGRSTWPACVSGRSSGSARTAAPPSWPTPRPGSGPRWACGSIRRAGVSGWRPRPCPRCSATLRRTVGRSAVIAFDLGTGAPGPLRGRTGRRPPRRRRPHDRRRRARSTPATAAPRCSSESRAVGDTLERFLESPLLLSAQGWPRRRTGHAVCRRLRPRHHPG